MGNAGEKIPDIELEYNTSPSRPGKSHNRDSCFGLCSFPSYHHYSWLDRDCLYGALLQPHHHRRLHELDEVHFQVHI